MSWHDYHPVWHVLMPKRSNNHKARIWHPAGLLWMIAIAAVMPMWLHYMSIQQPDVLGYASQISIEEVVNLTNQQRAQNGLPPLVLNEKLSVSARAKGENMIAENYWSHVSPSGTQPWYFFSQSGYNYRHAGENLARDFPTASAAMTAWMASPTHRDNILSPRYEDVGIAVMDGQLDGRETTLIVSHFGSQPSPVVAQLPEAASDSQTVSARVVNETPTEVLGQQGAVEHYVANVDVEALSEVPVYSPLDLTKSWSLAIAILVALVLMVDIYVVSHNQVARMSGRPVAHLMILATFILAILLTQPGLIL